MTVKTQEDLQAFLEDYQDICVKHGMAFYAEGRDAILALRSNPVTSWDVTYHAIQDADRGDILKADSVDELMAIADE